MLNFLNFISGLWPCKRIPLFLGYTHLNIKGLRRCSAFSNDLEEMGQRENNKANMAKCQKLLNLGKKNMEVFVLFLLLSLIEIFSKLKSKITLTIIIKLHKIKTCPWTFSIQFHGQSGSWLTSLAILMLFSYWSSSLCSKPWSWKCSITPHRRWPTAPLWLGLPQFQH